MTRHAFNAPKQANQHKTQEHLMRHKLSKITLGIIATTSLNMAATAQAQENQQADEQVLEVIEVSGIRQSLTSALAEKRSANNLVEVIHRINTNSLAAV